MKALTVLQPWATLITTGAKRIETRSWATRYRGPIAIHAGMGKQFLTAAFKEPLVSALFTEQEKRISTSYLRDRFILGKVVAIADLVDCIEMTMEYIAAIPEPERHFGWYEPGRYAWVLENVRPIDPVPVRGKQKLWEWEGSDE